MPSLESGTSLPQPTAAHRTSTCVDTHGAAASPRVAARHIRRWCSSASRTAPDVCPTTLALLASVQKQVAMPGLKVALISVDPERDTPEQLGKYIVVIRRRSYRPHRARARDCEGHDRALASAARASICPAAATPWTTRPRYSRSIPAPGSSRCSRRRFNAAALDARCRATRAGAVGRAGS